MPIRQTQDNPVYAGLVEHMDDAVGLVLETIDLAFQNETIVDDLRSKLFIYLQDVGAGFPKMDPEYCAETDALYLKKVEEGLLPRLENQRMQYLSKDFDPGNNWWGSEVEN